MKKNGLIGFMPSSLTGHELFIRFALLLICVGFWYNPLSPVSFTVLVLAWLIDGGLRRFHQTIQESFVQAMLLLCVCLLLGLLWGEIPENGRIKWIKYFMLLIFIPFYSLLNKERLPWVVGGLVTGYLGVLALGIYQSLVMGEQGIPLLGMSYLSFSATLGIGAVVVVCLADLSQSSKLRIVLWLVALALIWAQFHQNGRILLFATLATVLLLAFLRYKSQFAKFLGIAISVLMITAIFAYSSPVFQNRLAQVKNDIELLQQDNFSSSLGYRLAMWDVGLHGIAEHPFLGHGTGVPESYFERTILTYKNGVYKDLPEFQHTSHYHNDWIEIGMHIGMLGISVLMFLFWSWYQAFKTGQLSVLGIGLVSYIFLAGLTDTFIIFSRTQILLLMITAIAMHWHKQMR